MKSVKDPVLPAPADLLRWEKDMPLLPLIGGDGMLCTGNAGGVPYDEPRSMSASRQSPQSSPSTEGRVWNESFARGVPPELVPYICRRVRGRER